MNDTGYPDELEFDPVLTKLPKQAQPDTIGPIVKIDIINSGLQELVASYDVLTDLTNWLDKRTAVASAMCSNAEEAYKRSLGDAFVLVPKADGPEEFRKAKAAQSTDAQQKAYQQARMRHEAYKAELRALERQLKVVDATIWVRKAVMAGKGY